MPAQVSPELRRALRGLRHHRRRRAQRQVRRRSGRYDQRGLARKTRKTYEERARHLKLPTDAEEETLARFRAHLARRFQEVPLGTALPERAVAWHHLVAVLGLEEDAAKKWLPRLRKVDARARPAATDEQWAA